MLRSVRPSNICLMETGALCDTTTFGMKPHGWALSPWHGLTPCFSISGSSFVARWNVRGEDTGDAGVCLLLRASDKQTNRVFRLKEQVDEHQQICALFRVATIHHASRLVIATFPKDPIGESHKFPPGFQGPKSMAIPAGSDLPVIK